MHWLTLSPARRARRRLSKACGAPAAALLCLAAALCGGCSAPQATASEEASSRHELVARRADFQGLLLLTGELEAVRSEKIYVPRTPVWQLPIRWMEQDGVHATEGHKILELDNTQFTGDLEQTRLARSKAHNDLIRKRADVGGELSEKEFMLERRRIELEKARIEAAIPMAILPEREYQEFQLAVARAEFEHDNAAEDLETTRIASDAEIEELRIALERATDEIVVAERAIQELSLEAPRDGILVVAQNHEAGRKFQVGDNVWVGLAVMSIPDLSSMKVVAQLSDVDDGRIAVGDRARCTLDAYPELRFAGRVTEVAPIAQEDDNQSLRRSFRVEVHLDESDPEHMRPGMSVKVEVLPRPIEDVVVVPRAALDLDASPPRVLLADGSRAEVRLGPCTALECVVDEGLAAGVRLRRAG